MGGLTDREEPSTVFSSSPRKINENRVEHGGTWWNKGQTSLTLQAMPAMSYAKAQSKMWSKPIIQFTLDKAVAAVAAVAHNRLLVRRPCPSIHSAVGCVNDIHTISVCAVCLLVALVYALDCVFFCQGFSEDFPHHTGLLW